MDFLTPTTIDVLVSVLFALGGAIIGIFFKGKTAKAEKAFNVALPVAVVVVQEVAKRTPNKVDDLVAYGLAKLSSLLAAQGTELTPAQTEKATAVFKTLHAESVAQEVK